MDNTLAYIIGILGGLFMITFGSIVVVDLLRRVFRPAPAPFDLRRPGLD